LVALEATLALYQTPSALRDPRLAQLTEPASSLRERRAIGRRRRRAREIIGQSSVGGGRLPIAEIASVAIAIGWKPVMSSRRLRRNDPPIIGRIADGR
jgi:seryl-tRNA(Sec) selenium transferase